MTADRTAWLESRRKGIGGTDAPAILGLSRWRTPIDVWQDKLGLSPERPQSAPMRWGLALEDAIADAYSEETGRRVRRVGMRRAKHVKDYPMLGSIDRMTYLSDQAPRVVELKTARSSDGWARADEWRDLPPERRVPADYYVQVQHYLEVVDAELADVAVLFSGSDFRVIEIPRDSAFGADLRDEEGRFWRDYVLTETQPPVSAGDLDYLARKYPQSSDDEIVATAELSALVDEIVRIDAESKSLETSRNLVRARIEEAIGTASRLVSGSATVTWKSSDRTTVSWKDYAGVLEAAIAELRAAAPRKVPIEVVLSDRFGTTDLADVRSLYSQTAAVRPFRVEKGRKS